MRIVSRIVSSKTTGIFRSYKLQFLSFAEQFTTKSTRMRSIWRFDPVSKISLANHRMQQSQSRWVERFFLSHTSRHMLSLVDALFISSLVCAPYACSRFFVVEFPKNLMWRLGCASSRDKILLSLKNFEKKAMLISEAKTKRVKSNLMMGGGGS